MSAPSAISDLRGNLAMGVQGCRSQPVGPNCVRCGAILKLAPAEFSAPLSVNFACGSIGRGEPCYIATVTFSVSGYAASDALERAPR
jgi:hypothetical protein